METLHSLHAPVPAVATAIRSHSRLTGVLRSIVVLYLLGMVVLSVEQFLALPSNLASVDFWNLLLLPVCWLYLIQIRQPVRFPYAIGMWFILVGSFIGTFFAYNPLVSIIVIIKEVYLYVWCITLAAVFASLEPRLLRRILLAWLAVAVLHGILLIAEFVSPNFYGFMISALSRIGFVDSRYIGRPAGLFENPVWAALFELMAFVPLLLAGLRRELALLLGMLLLSGILATASLGALSALLAGLILAVLLLLLIGGHMKSLVWFATALTIAAGVFFLILTRNPDILASLQHLTVARAGYTAGQRFDLWQGSSEILFSDKSILGIGLNNYRDPLAGKTLHNDFLEFAVERGVIGLLGLMLFAGEAWMNAIKIFLQQIKSPDAALPSGVIFMAMLFGILLESNSQQVFHFRTIWLGLALLEATLSRMMFQPVAVISRTGSEDQMPQMLSDSPDPLSAEMQ